MSIGNATLATTLAILAGLVPMGGCDRTGADAGRALAAQPPPATPSAPPAGTRDAASPQSAPASPTDAATAADAVARAERNILEAWDGVCSLTATVTVNFERRKGFKTEQKGRGRIELEKHDDRLLVRYETWNWIKALQLNGEDWLYTTQVITKICDGEYLYSTDKRFESETVRKTYCAGPAFPVVGGEKLVRHIRQLRDRKLLPEETIDGRNVYVFHGLGTKESLTMTYYVDKETGIVLRRVMNRDRDDATVTFSLSDLELDRDLPDERFQYIPDPYVPITDLTKRLPAADPGDSAGGPEDE